MELVNCLDLRNHKTIIYIYIFKCSGSEKRNYKPIIFGVFHVLLFGNPYVQKQNETYKKNEAWIKIGYPR